MLGDAEQAGPGNESVKVPNREAILCSAELWLGDTQPAGDHILGQRAAAVQRMAAVGAKYPAEVAAGEGGAQFDVIPELGRHRWRSLQAFAVLLAAGATSSGAVVAGQAGAAGAE